MAKVMRKEARHTQRRDRASGPISILDPSNLGDSSSRVVYFCLFILFMGFLQQVYQIELPFPSLVNHI